MASWNWWISWTTDLAPPDFHLFGPLKEKLRDEKFNGIDGVKINAPTSR